MEVHVNDITKTVEIWLTQGEANDAELRAEFKPLCAGYKSQKYVVAVFESGNGSLLNNTRDLILHNRMLNGG